MAIHWDESLILGIAELDEQHRTIVEKYSELSEATQNGSSNEVIVEMLSFLMDYARLHFALEDRYMVKYAYPDAAQQHAEHSEFTRNMNDFKARMEDSGVSRELAIALSGKLVQWIIVHIRSHDKDMYAYFKEKMKDET